MLQKKINMQGQVFAHNNIDCTEYAPEFFRVLKDGAHCYVMTNHVNLIHMLNTFTAVGFHFIKSLVWDKGNKIMGQYYMSQFEYILFFRKGRGVRINNCGTSDILSVPNIKTKDENNIVLDPFMGVGSAGIASKKLNRNFIGIEIDNHYYNIAKERILKAAS